MKLQSRDKRALAGLAAAAVALLVFHFATAGDSGPTVTGVSGGIPAAEKRLARLRRLAASVQGKEQVLKQVSAELEQRETAVIQAETANQAQAQVLQVLRRVAKAQEPPLEIRSFELGQIRPFGEQYGEVLVSVSLECRIEELVNLLAAITAQPELVALYDLRIGVGNAKEKTVNARLTVSGVVPRRLVPEKKGLGRF